jgi:superfamily II DNA or RNA helicase
MAADSFMETCCLFPARHRLGLSATPKRPDGKTFVLDMHIGPLMVRGKDVPMKPKVFVKKTEWTLPRVPRLVNGEWRKVPLPVQAGRMTQVYNAMAKDAFRNRKIANYVEQMHRIGRNQLVVTATKEHIDKLFQAFTERGIPGEHIGYYVGGMSQTELTAHSKRKVVLATKGMVGEGTNCPWWDAGCAAVPFANIDQIIGRVLRSHPGKPQPLWADFVDDVMILKTFANKRMTYYYKIGSTIVHMDKATA